MTSLKPIILCKGCNKEITKIYSCSKCKDSFCSEDCYKKNNQKHIEECVSLKIFVKDCLESAKRYLDSLPSSLKESIYHYHDNKSLLSIGVTHDLYDKQKPPLFSLNSNVSGILKKSKLEGMKFKDGKDYVLDYILKLQSLEIVPILIYFDNPFNNIYPCLLQELFIYGIVSNKYEKVTKNHPNDLNFNTYNK